MEQDHTEKGRISDRGKGLGTVTEAMVRARASELAVINGRGKHDILDSDLEEARRELTGQEGLVPPSTPEENIPEGDRWGTETNTGEKVEAVPSPDEQTVAERLVEEGVADAEHEQELEATREDLRRERGR